MEQQATVRSLNGRNAVIEVRRRTACGHDCDQCHGCPHPDETIAVSAVNDCGAQPGDRVTVESSSGRVLSLAALVYLLPIVLMALGYLAVSGSEKWRILGAFAGLALGVGACVLVSRRMSRRGTVAFHVTHILDENR